MDFWVRGQPLAEACILILFAEMPSPLRIVSVLDEKRAVHNSIQDELQRLRVTVDARQESLVKFLPALPEFLQFRFLTPLPFNLGSAGLGTVCGESGVS